MTPGTAVSLVVLALVDSTSFGTLLIPLWLLLAPGPVRWGRVLLFLGTVACSYLLLGVALAAGVAVAPSGVVDLLDTAVAHRVQLVLGVGLLVWSAFLGRRPRTGRLPGRLLRWRERALGGPGRSSAAGVAALAVGAAALEAATMLPYLGAIGLLSTTELSGTQRTGVLAGYCLVMIAPALALLAARVLASRRVEPVLARVAGWMERTGGETTAWVVGILGFLLARDAALRVPELVDLLR